MKELILKISKPPIIFGLLFLIFFGVFGAITAYRAVSGSNDFDTFYYAGRAVLEGSSLFGDATGETVSPFLYPPFAACFFALFAWLPIKFAAWAWCLTNLVLLSMSLWMLYLFFPIFKFKKAALFYLICILAIVIDNLTMAQANILVFSSCLAGVYFWQKKINFTGGLCLAFASLIKLTPLLFLPYFILKKQWKVVAGFLTGLLIGAFVIGTMVFGYEQNTENHKRWFQGLLGPMVASMSVEKEAIDLLHPQAPAPVELWDEPAMKQKRRDEVKRKNRLSSLLNQKNQSLEAVFSRWFLKDRNQYYENEYYSIYGVRHYLGLPVIGGGIGEEELLKAITWLNIIFLVLFCLIGVIKNKGIKNWKIEIPFLFLTLTLLAPYTRSHHYITWLMACVLFFKIEATEAQTSFFPTWAARVAFGMYFLQVIPYGKAMGLGFLANLILWSILAVMLVKPVSQNSQNQML